MRGTKGTVVSRPQAAQVTAWCGDLAARAGCGAGAERAVAGCGRGAGWRIVLLAGTGAG